MACKAPLSFPLGRQRIGCIYDFAADRDIDRNDIITGSMAASIGA